MRQNLPKLNNFVEDLDVVLQRVYRVARSNKATRLEKYMVIDHGWGEARLAAFARAKEALKSMATLTHPDPAKAFGAAVLSDEP
jgi:hypothetical protein